MSTARLWPAFGTWGTGSPETGSRAALTASVTTSLMSPSMTPHGWPMKRFWRRSKRRRPLDSLHIQSNDFTSSGSSADVCFRTMALCTAPLTGEKPAVPWISDPSAPSPTRRRPTARRNVLSRLSWWSGPTSSPNRPQQNKTTGYLSIWGSLTAAGATGPGFNTRRALQSPGHRTQHENQRLLAEGKHANTSSGQVIDLVPVPRVSSHPGR